jgi:hypothetical protein
MNVPRILKNVHERSMNDHERSQKVGIHDRGSTKAGHRSNFVKFITHEFFLINHQIYLG